MEAGNDRPHFETDTKPDDARQQANSQYTDGLEAINDTGQPPPSLAKTSEVSAGCEPVSAPAPVDNGEVAAKLARLEERFASGLAEILKAIQDKLAFDQFKENQITRLHDELQGYKADLLAKASRPFVSGVIRLHDDVRKMTNALRKLDAAALSAEKFFKVIEGFQQDIELILDQNGIEAYREPGERFDPRRQKALVTIPTSEALTIGSIAERLYPGFEQGGFVFQKERVAVYVSANTTNPPADNDGSAPVAAALTTAKEGEEK